MEFSDILNDAELAEDFTVLRSSGSFVAGRWVENTPTQLPFFGPICPATRLELQMLPKGDRVQEAMTFRSQSPIYTTRTGQNAGTSDKVLYRGELYRIGAVRRYKDQDYYQAIGIRIQGS